MQANGTVESEHLGLSDEDEKSVVLYDRAAKEKMSQDLGLPPLLESKRRPWCMVDAVFSKQASYDRVLVFQIPEHELETFMVGGKIVMPDQTRESRRYHAARGIVVSAGLKALDVLRSNGMDLGHTVNFISSCPYRLEVDFVAGKAVEVLVMNVGDIVASEDLATVLRSGVVHIQNRDQSHVIVDESGNAWDPVAPWVPDDSV